MTIDAPKPIEINGVSWELRLWEPDELSEDDIFDMQIDHESQRIDINADYRFKMTAMITEAVADILISQSGFKYVNFNGDCVVSVPLTQFNNLMQTVARIVQSYLRNPV